MVKGETIYTAITQSGRFVMDTTQLGLLEFGTVSKDKPIELTPWQFSVIVSHDESFNVFALTSRRNQQRCTCFSFHL